MLVLIGLSSKSKLMKASGPFHPFEEIGYSGLNIRFDLSDIIKWTGEIQSASISASSIKSARAGFGTTASRVLEDSLFRQDAYGK